MINKNKRYFPSEIEPKWQEKWKKDGLYNFKDDSKKQKYYNLVELPYPSGDLHFGHWFSFVPADAHARYKRMSGFNVFFPNGFDAFGLPAENAAIKRGVHPKDWTMKNIENMTKQFGTMGTMIDWNYTAITCLPEYYRWNQWIFLKMFEKGLAYRGKALSNWCPIDKTVLANEHIEAGKCWRCGAEVIQKEVEQWFLAITKYADELIWKNPPQADWPKEVREGQNNWIGRSEGLLIDFGGVEVFTTRPETADGATFLVVSPEHPFVQGIKNKEVEDYIKQAKKKTEMERKEDRTKSGIFTGKYVKNPVTGKDIPVWISDYVLAGYGTGAIMAVPFADERDREFAEKFDLSITETNFKAKPKGKKRVNYHLRDWSVSRQRYWGTPVPIIHCEKCGLVAVPYEDLPVELPYNVDYTPKGKPPLATDEEWLNVKCPKCQGAAKRDAETLDTFFDSAWYYYRYVSPKYEKAPFDKSTVKELLPVDVYFGGAEHTLGHTLYARFFTKFFKDLGLVNFDEFASKRVQHGVILGPDGNRMSKSRGNVVNPDEIIKEYGTDASRLYLCFMMPYEATAPWSTGAISGIYRFLKRVWELRNKVKSSKLKVQSSLSKEDLNQMHTAIKKVGEDLENFHFNTAVAALMTWLNFLSGKKEIGQEEYETFIKLLSPFAPHITEEIWQSLNKSANSIHLEKWPEYNPQYLVQDEVPIVVQVNGKVRDTITIQNSELRIQSKVEDKAGKSEKVQKHLAGKQIKKVIYVEGKIINFVAI
ncbi:MAG: leucine--tRNA ligase [Patescibacteria group bacterium]|nr:leucine--tRNA ligase [Patescibacteria group bacterium]